MVSIRGVDGGGVTDGAPESHAGGDVGVPPIYNMPIPHVDAVYRIYWVGYLHVVYYIQTLQRFSGQSV